MNKLGRYYQRVVLFLMPLVFLPVVMEPFGFGKQWIVLALGLVGLVIWVVGMAVEKKNSLKTNGLWWWLVVLLGWAMVSWLRMQPGLRMNAVMAYFGLESILAIVVWSFLWLQQEEEEREVQMNYLTAAGIVVVLASLVVFLIPNNKLPIAIPKDNPVVTITSSWSVTGSLTAEIIFLTFLVMEWFRRLMKKVKVGNYIGQAAVMALLTLVLLLDVYRLNKVGWVRLDGNSGWVVAAESFKNSPIWGVGIGNFSNAFSLWRPVSYNMTKYWGNGFKLTSMTGLQIWTELGLVGLLVIVMMTLMIIGNRKKSFEFGRILIFFLIVMLMPFDLMGWLLLGWLVAGKLLEKKKIGLNFKVGETGLNIAPILTIVVVVGAVGFAGYWWTRVLLGDVYLRQSLVAAAKNNGGDTYNKQIKAIGINPYSGEYRRMYSQTNFALAMTLLGNKDISDEDKEKASVLVEQAVREAKAAVALDPQNSFYWSNLAVIYRQLVGLVEGTADWSYQAYSQAAALDPTNVLTKLDLGGLLFAAGNYAESERTFEQAVVSKQDFANGWYNWAYAGYKQGKLGEAVQRLTQAVSLVSVDSGDYEKATKELDAWKKEYDAAVAKLKQQQQQEQPKAAETLKTPGPLPTGSQENKVDVPKEVIEPPKITPQPTVSISSPSPTAGE
jgi:tetratricopeptide (TPR) repeat protein